MSTDASGERSFAIGTSSTEIDEQHRGASSAGQGSIAFGDQAVVGTKIPSSLSTTERERRGTDIRVNDSIAVGTNSFAQARNALALGGGISYTYHENAGTSKMTNKTMYYNGAKWVADAEGTGANVGVGADGGVAIGIAQRRTRERRRRNAFQEVSSIHVTSYLTSRERGLSCP